jgi:GT2 family glycosyltransferase
VHAATVNMNAEIIVVDNDSEDASCQMVKELFPEVILIENKQNFGFSKGNNIGVSQAKGEYLCILNPDTVVAEDTFENLLKFSEDKEKLGVVGCKLINGVGEFLPESKRNVPVLKAAFRKLFGNSKYYYATHLDKNGIGKVDVLVGAFMFMKRNLFFEMGCFDEDYFMYGEDIDLSYSVLKAGYHNYYVGTISVIHFKGESTLRNKHYAKRFYGAMRIFYKKHFKKNWLFDVLVMLGIKFVYFFRKLPVHKLKTINHYAFISDKMDVSLERSLSKEVFLMADLKNMQPYTEIIFDANMLSFKKIISMLENHEVGKHLTFKILPKNSNFILGSDNAISQGEIIFLN